MRTRRIKIVLAMVGVLAIIAVALRVSYPELSAKASQRSLPLQPTAERPRTRRGGMDVTFLVTADTHFGHGVAAEPEKRSLDDVQGIEQAHIDGIEAMNSIADKPFPSEIGGKPGRPLGVLVAGDLTDDGKPREWARFEQFFGLTGSDGLLRYPVFEGIGNHDKHYGFYVKEQIARRHGDNRYSWDWHDLHLVCLGEAPDDEDLAWLERDLDAVGAEIGIVIYFHFPLEGPFSQGHWFGDRDYRDKFRKSIDGRNVLGVFHGHFHGTGPYQWRGLDVFNVGSAKHGRYSFAVVRVRDDRMTVASYNYRQKRWWWWHDKPIFGADGRARVWRAPGQGLVGPTGWPAY
jgi:cytolysin (calcineurin-like family phosphatase)